MKGCLKAIFIEHDLKKIECFLSINDITYEWWYPERDYEPELRVAVDMLDDEELLKLFKFLGSEFEAKMLNIIDEYDYLIFWE